MLLTIASLAPFLTKPIHLDDPLKSLGEFHVPIKLHREVTAHVKVTVGAEGAEAGA